MITGNVTFGRVIAVSGKDKKMEKVNRKLFSQVRDGSVMVKDVTHVYKNAASSGELAQAAQRGEVVDVYITGRDIDKIKQKEAGWGTLREIIGKIEDCFSANTMSTSDVVRNIVNKKG